MVQSRLSWVKFDAQTHIRFVTGTR